MPLILETWRYYGQMQCPTDVDGSMHDSSISITHALEIMQSCPTPSKWFFWLTWKYDVAKVLSTTTNTFACWWATLHTAAISTICISGLVGVSIQTIWNMIFKYSLVIDFWNIQYFMKLPSYENHRPIRTINPYGFWQWLNWHCQAKYQDNKNLLSYIAQFK